jgi:uncharacterized protein DUF4255
MSSALAIGAVSAVLRNLLDNAMVNVGPIGPVTVTAVAPDVIDLEEAEPKASLNLFLYRTSLNQGWANVGLPAFDGNGNQASHPPLGLNLHYLLTAYGFADFEAEILLGYAMHVLHEHPVLDRDSIRTALDPSPLDASILPPAFQALTAADLADQVENVTITPEPLDTEELARLWSAIQSHYRPTVGYVVSVVLIDARKPARKPLPVLERSLIAEPSLLPPYPTITRIEPDDSQPAARLNEHVRLVGHHLDGTGATARFEHRLLDEPNEIPIGAITDPTGIDLTLPTGPTAEQDWPAGVYLVSVELTRPGDLNPRTTNVAAMLLAPEPQLPPTTLTRNVSTRSVTATLDVSPEVRPAQDARLTLGGTSAPANPHPTQTGTLTFELGDVAPGHQWVRLTVDGVDSLLLDRTSEPPSFHANQSVTVPA